MRSQEPDSSSSKQLTIRFLMSLTALFSEQAKRVSKKLKTLPRGIAANSPSFQLPANSPLRGMKPKKLLTSISNKAITFVQRKKKGEDGLEEDEFGDGGVWRRAILMGDRCQPLDFSGVIYYDSNGKVKDEVPARSPRATPLPKYLTQA